MDNTVKISNYQIISILVCFILGSSIIINPAAAAKQEGWLAFILGWAGGLLLITIYTWIALLNPGKNLVAILKENFGKFVGSLISVFYIWYFLHLAALVLRNFGEFAITVNYPETPLYFIICSFVLVIIYAVKKDIEVIGRFSEVFAFFFVIVLTFVFFSLMSKYKFDNLKPFFEQSTSTIIKTGFSTLTFPFGEAIAFLMIFPLVRKQENLKKSVLWSVGIAGFLLLAAIIRNQMFLGTQMLSRDVFPSHVVYRLIPHLDVDPLLDLNFTMGGIVKISICLYAAATGVAELFNLCDYKVFVFPLAAFSASLSVWLYDSLSEMLDWAEKIWPYYSIPFQILIPILLLVVSMIKQRKDHKEAL